MCVIVGIPLVLSHSRFYGGRKLAMICSLLMSQMKGFFVGSRVVNSFSYHQGGRMREVEEMVRKISA